jgi:ABC-2 type transport system permease protein
MVQTLRYYLHIYLLIEVQYIKARMQYRTDFIISSFGMLASCITGLLVFKVLFSSIPDLAGWRFYELMFIYGFYLLAISPLQILFDNIWWLRYKIQDGSFIKYYFRPVNMMFYYMSEVFDVKGLTQLVVGILALAYASIKLGLHWTVFKIALLFFMLFGSSLVIVSILVIAACMAFWVLASYPILALAFRLREFSTYPVTIFDGMFRFLFTYVVPLGFIAYYPAQVFLRTENAPVLAYASPLVGITFFALAYWVWNQGVTHYTGTGT